MQRIFAAIFLFMRAIGHGHFRERKMDFYVGQRVVCVSVDFSREPVWRSVVRVYPRLGGIYTIRSICEAGDLIGFCFDEFVNPRGHFSRGYVEPAFDSRKFRPVRTTSIEVFRRLLAPQDQEEGTQLDAGDPSKVPTELV